MSGPNKALPFSLAVKITSRMLHFTQCPGSSHGPLGANCPPGGTPGTISLAKQCLAGVEEERDIKQRLGLNPWAERGAAPIVTGKGERVGK